MAYTDEEHAVLMVKLEDHCENYPIQQEKERTHLGPFKLKVLPILLLMIPGSTPVAA
jgi:hypothetical protein